MRGVRLPVLFLTCFALFVSPLAGAAEAATAPSPRQTYNVYRQLRARIVQGTVGVKDQAAFDLVLTTAAERKKAADLLTRASDREAREALHRLFIRARPTPDLMYGYLKRELPQSLALADRRTGRRGSLYAWQTAYHLEGALTAFERTGQQRFLTLARDAMLEILAERDDRHGRVDQYRRRVVRTWGSTFNVNGVPRFTNVVTHAGRIVTPMARYAVIVARRRGLPAKHHQAADRLLAAATAALREFEGEFRTRDNGTYGFYWRTIHDQREGLNHQTSVGEALIHVAQATGERRWKRRSVQVARFVRRVMYRDTNGTLVWRYNATPTNRRSGPLEAIWKAQVTVRYMTLAERSGLVFDRDTLKEVGRTIRVNVLLPKDGVNWVVSAERPRMKPRYGGLKNVPRFLLLEPYDSGLGKELLGRLARDPHQGGWFTHATAVAYAARLPTPASGQGLDDPELTSRGQDPSGVDALAAVDGINARAPRRRRRRGDRGCGALRRNRLLDGGGSHSPGRPCAAPDRGGRFAPRGSLRRAGAARETDRFP